MFGSGIAPTGGIVNTPSVPPAPLNQPSMPQVAGGNLIGTIFNALFNPDMAAQQMAQSGISPIDFARNLNRGGHLANVMDTGLSERLTMPPEVAGMKASVGNLMTGVGSGLTSQTRNRMFASPSEGVRASEAPPFMGENINWGKIFGSILGQRQAPLLSPTQAPIAPPILPPTAGQPTAPIIPPVLPPVQPETLPALPAEPIIASDGTGGAVATINRPYGGRGTTPVGNAIYDEFMSTVRAGGVTNPNALAAIASTGKSESGFNEKNAYSVWDDVGKPSGGIMSWRDDRLKAMQNFVKANGGDPNKPSPALQAKFLLQENPQLIQQLNAAKTPEEAQILMNNAWRFKGYDQPGGEAQRRIELAKYYAGTFGEGVAAAGVGDPWAAMRGGVQGMPGGGGAAAASPLDALGEALQMPSGGQQDLNLPQAPSPIGPRPGQYSPDANVMRTILAMLAPGFSSAQIPTLGMLMSGRTVGG